ncbi:hypothetical protein LCGC14_2962450, partial [marine sediment metagenome]
LGLSARADDPLIIIDIDNPKFQEQLPKKTLTATSRKRAGSHAFCWDKDGSAKKNIPTDFGEMRSDNQYVLACGSYVPFNLENKKDKDAYDKLPHYAKDDKLIGYYTIEECIIPRKIDFNGLPDLFKNKVMDDLEEEANIKNNNKKKEFTGVGKYSELFKLKVSDIVGLIPANKRQGHPLHESDTDSNFSLTKDGTLGHCWRHLVSLNAVQYLCVKNGYSKCEDAGTPHKGRGISKIRGDKKAYKVAYKEAVKLGLIGEYKKEIKKSRKLKKFILNKQKDAIYSYLLLLLASKNTRNFFFLSLDFKFQEIFLNLIPLVKSLKSFIEGLSIVFTIKGAKSPFFWFYFIKKPIKDLLKLH